MDIKTTIRTLMTLPPRRSVYVMSDHGYGKSQVIAQVARMMAKKLNKPFGFIDIRLSQREVGDLIGLPRSRDTFTIQMPSFDPSGKKIIQEVEAKNVMVHDIPLWFPTDPNSCGYLFFDELPYAPKDVIAAIFEVALDYRLNFNDLPIGWRVLAAGNHNQDIYGGTTINPALWDRFLKIWFKPTVPEWQDHARDIGVLAAIRQYISKFPTDLDPPENMEIGTTYPSRRSWVTLSEDWVYMKNAGDDPAKDRDWLTLLVKGRVGDTIAINFTDWYYKNYRVYTVEELLNKFTNTMESDLKSMDVTEVTFYTKEIVDHVKKSGVKKLTAKQNENLARFFKAIPKEAASGFWIAFAKTARDPAMTWYNETPGIVDYIAAMLIKDKAVA